ncbi:hypothetical protein KY362_00780 [Candidatus Woesearchaeota archaeon]|nr:hypothetical protein [Candidatus Woesearchaeota archaeon]
MEQAYLETAERAPEGPEEHILSYMKPSQLVRRLASLPETPDSIDLVVTSEESIMVGDEFPGESVVLPGGLDGLKRGADGARFYAGELVNVVFEDFYLGGIVKLGRRRVEIVPEQYFAKLAKSVAYGPWGMDALGNINREITDYEIFPRNAGWHSELLDSASSLVARVADTTGVDPFFMFKDLGLFVFPYQISLFLAEARVRNSKKASVDADFPHFIL